jgi:hypothetical protein
MPQFTTANAAEMARRSHAARKLREAERKAQAALPPASARRPAAETQVAAHLEIVREQIRLAVADLSKKMEPHHRAQLLRALDCLLDRERELVGIPRLKPQEGRRRSASPFGGSTITGPPPPLQVPPNIFSLP